MVYEDPRFPNRKRPRAEDTNPGFNIPLEETHPAAPEKPLDPLVEAGLPASSGEKVDIEHLRYSSYRIIGEEPQRPREKAAAAPPPNGSTLEGLSLSAAAEEPKAAPEAPIAAPLVDEALPAPEYSQPIVIPPPPPAPAPPAPAKPSIPWRKIAEECIKRYRQFAENKTRLYVTAAAGLGVFLGIILAVVLWHMNHPEGPTDLGSASFNAAGMKGYLNVRWDEKLHYRLRIEPTDLAPRAGFTLAVANSPRPLSVEIHLQDSQGFALCSKRILLRYDARGAAAFAAAYPEQQPITTDAAAIVPPSPVTDFAREDAREAAREQGNDVFQNEIGPDGGVAALTAEGDLPCTASAYEGTFSWGISPDFPSIAEQNEYLARQQEARSGAERKSAQATSESRRSAAKAAAKLLPFSIEGDDSIVEFDPTRGYIECSGRKIFFFDRSGGNVMDPRWQDFPVSIHYRCDPTASCVLTHAGLGVLHVRLRR